MRKKDGESGKGGGKGKGRKKGQGNDYGEVTLDYHHPHPHAHPQRCSDIVNDINDSAFVDCLNQCDDLVDRGKTQES